MKVQNLACAGYSGSNLADLSDRYGPKGRCRSSFSLVEWAKQEEVREAWQVLANDYQLESDPLAGADGMFAALQFSLTMSWSWATKLVIQRTQLTLYLLSMLTVHMIEWIKLANLDGMAMSTRSSRCGWSSKSS